jgi:hypothetical protein
MYPLAGRNPGLLLASLLDIRDWEDICTEWGWVLVRYVEGVEQRKKPKSTSCGEGNTLASAHMGSSFLDPEDV